MKKLLSVFVLFVGVFLLVACSSTKNVDGTYYNFINSSNTNRVIVTEDETAIVKGDKLTLTWGSGKVYAIDYSKHTATSGDDVYYFGVKDDILTLGDDTYVLSGSSKLEELEKLSKEGKPYEKD